MTDLQPLTTYTFRVRAFNAFGAGPYTTRHLTTGPASADITAPVVARCGPDSVTLRWDPHSEIAARLATLQELFDAIDTDGSGCVGVGASVRQCAYAVASGRVRSSMFGWGHCAVPPSKLAVALPPCSSPRPSFAGLCRGPNCWPACA